MVISRFLVVIGEIGGTFRRLMVSSSLDNSVVDFLAFFSFAFADGLSSLWLRARTCVIRSATSKGLASAGTPCSCRKVRVSSSITVENVSSRPFSSPGQCCAIQSYISRAVHPPGMRPFITTTSK